MTTNATGRAVPRRIARARRDDEPDHESRRRSLRLRTTRGETRETDLRMGCMGCIGCIEFHGPPPAAGDETQRAGVWRSSVDVSSHTRPFRGAPRQRRRVPARRRSRRRSRPAPSLRREARSRNCQVSLTRTGTKTRTRTSPRAYRTMTESRAHPPDDAPDFSPFHPRTESHLSFVFHVQPAARRATPEPSALGIRVVPGRPDFAIMRHEVAIREMWIHEESMRTSPLHRRSHIQIHPQRKMIVTRTRRRDY